jgi:hypothetical protein
VQLSCGDCRQESESSASTRNQPSCELLRFEQAMHYISPGTIIAAAQLHDCVVLAADRLHERQAEWRGDERDGVCSIVAHDHLPCAIAWGGAAELPANSDGSRSINVRELLKDYLSHAPIERQIMSDALLRFIDSAILPLVRTARQTRHADGSLRPEDAADIVTAAYCSRKAQLSRFRVSDRITPIPGYRAGLGWLRRLLIHKPDGHLIYPAHFAPHCLFEGYDRGAFVVRRESYLVAAHLMNVVEGFTRWDANYPDKVRECGAPVDVVIVNDRGVQIIY